MAGMQLQQPPQQQQAARSSKQQVDHDAVGDEVITKGTSK